MTGSGKSVCSDWQSRCGVWRFAYTPYELGHLVKVSLPIPPNIASASVSLPFRQHLAKVLVNHQFGDFQLEGRGEGVAYGHSWPFGIRPGV
jgi:hypothetical protein